MDRRRPQPATQQEGLEAVELVGQRLAKLDTATLFSSPYVRVHPDARAVLERTGIIRSGGRSDGCARTNHSSGQWLDLLRELRSDRSSTHGDIIPATMQALVHRGMKMSTPPDWRKAAVWVLKRNTKGDIVHVKVWPPPVI